MGYLEAPPAGRERPVSGAAAGSAASAIADKQQIGLTKLAKIAFFANF